MQSKGEFLAAVDLLESNLTESILEMRGSPSPQGHDREFDLAIIRLEESLMWMRRAIERKFAP